MKKTFLNKSAAYKAAAFYALYFTFYPLINPGITHWKNVLVSSIVALVTVLGVQWFSCKTES